MSNPLKNLELSSEELKEIARLLAKERYIKGYKSTLTVCSYHVMYAFHSCLNVKELLARSRCEI